MCQAPPDKPQIQSVVANATKISVIWDPLQSNGGQPLDTLYYYLDYYEVSSFGSPVPNTRHLSKNFSHNVNKAIISPLLSLTYYSVSVVAFNKIGRNSSSWKRVQTIGYPPDQPIITNVTIAINAIGIKWNIASTGGYNGSKVQLYIEYQKWSDYFNTSGNGLIKILAHGNEHRISNLLSNTDYRLRITVRNPVATRSSVWINATTTGTCS